MYPRLVCNIEKIKNNITTILDLSKQKNINISAVVKGMSAWPDVVEVIVKSGVTSVADSRLLNLKKISHIPAEKLLLRIPMISELNDVVKFADISLNSEMETINLLDTICKNEKLKHGIMLMIDVGDRREGILPKDISKYIGAIKNLKNIYVAGVGMNITCYGAVLPSKENLSILVKCAQEMESALGYKLRYISGGNSSSYMYMLNGNLPEKINHLRLGEVLLQGRETEFGRIVSGLDNDTFFLQAEVIELKVKSSLPEGRQGIDGFGNKPSFEDKGLRKRAIVAIGRQDINMNTYSPFDSGIEVLGASSDHMILDVTDSKQKISVGSIIDFHINYEGLLSLSTSEYVHKVILREEDL